MKPIIFWAPLNTQGSSNYTGYRPIIDKQVKQFLTSQQCEYFLLWGDGEGLRKSLQLDETNFQ